MNRTRKPRPVTGLSTRERNIIARLVKERAEAESQEYADLASGPSWREPWRVSWLRRLARKIEQGKG